jgi:enoyl-CoA hydratase
MSAALTSATTEVLLEHDEGSVRWLTINRESVHNALNTSVLQALSAALDRVESDRAVRAVVISGAGRRAFSAGADLDELAGISTPTAYRVLESGGRVLSRLDRLPVPVVAAVNGLAFGGGFELALSCTFMMASTNAVFAFPETRLGLMPGYGGTQRLARQVGHQVARAMILTGTRVSAETAREVGLLFSAPTPPDELMSAVSDLVSEVVACGPDATTSALEALRIAGEVPLAVGLNSETLLAAICVGSDEAAFGIEAFRQRRPAEFGARSA